MTNEPSGEARTRVSRETRLLLVTVVVCALVLLVLARWRFPDLPEVETTAAPLQRLAARASYEALAADIQRVESLIAPNLVGLRVAPPSESASSDLRDVLTRTDPPFGFRHIAALRIGVDTALASIDPGARVDGLVGPLEPPGGGELAAIVGVDLVRRLARIRLPNAPPRPLALLPLTSLQTPMYVVAVEGTQAGVTLRPVFLGRGDRFGSSRWSRPLLPLGAVAVAPGALLFSLAGEFVGVVVVEHGVPAIAGARDVLETVERLASAPTPVLSDPGLALQPLTRELRAALGADRGVVISAVDGAGAAAAGGLQPADVITGIDSWSTDSPDELLLRLAGRPPGEPVVLHTLRGGAARSVTITLSPARLDAAPGGSMNLAIARGAGVRLDSPPDGSLPGLRQGDVITRAGSIAAPTPQQLRRQLSQPAPGGFLVLLVRRGDRQLVVAVPVPGRSDATPR